MNLLDRLQLSFRCPADWDAMEGDERSRFCDQCRKRVHNLAAMTREEAEALVSRGNEVCVRLVRRSDGSTVVKDCPKPAAARAAAVRLAGAGLAAGGGLALASCASDADPPPMMGTPAIESDAVIVGAICPPEPDGISGPDSR